jgi:DHA2 family metal-tetracycline-proton antiporter-like MFS transporter
MREKRAGADLPPPSPRSYFSPFGIKGERTLAVQLQATRDHRKLVPWIIYLIFFAVLNETVFNVSTPMIARQFSLTPSGVSWMMTIFMVFFGIGSVIYGRLADIFSLRTLIMVGVLIYNAGSLLGFALQFSYPLVVAARAVQGMGGSAIPALVFVVVARYFDPSERGRIFGFITSMVSFAIGLGPVLGGFVSGTLSWSYLFLIPVLMVVALPFLNRELPREPRREGAVDVIGAALVALTVGGLIVFLNFSRWYYLAAFLGLLSLFVVRIRTARNPFITPSLFANTRFRAGVVVGFCLFAIVIGTMFLIPLMLSDVYGITTSQIGLILFPGAISSVIFGPIAGTLSDRRGSNFVVAAGLALLATSIVALSLLLSVSVLVVAAALLLTNVGFSLFQTAMVNAVSQTLAEHETGIGMGIFNLVGIISGAVGTALVGKALTGRWLDFPVAAVRAIPRAYGYSNVMLAFFVVLILGGVLYLRAYRGMGAVKPLKQLNGEG